MNRAEFPRLPGQQVDLRIGSLRITGASRIEARRLAEALPAALEAALAGRTVAPARRSAADDLALRILDAVQQTQGRQP